MARRVFSTGARRPPGGPVELTIRPGRTGGMGGAGSHTLHRSRLIRHPDAPRNRSTRASPRGTGFGTGFSHTVEFSRNVAGLLFGRLARGSRVNLSSPERRDGTTGLSRSSKASHLSGKRTPAGVPPATSAPSHRSAAPSPASPGRQDGHRTAVGSTPTGARRPPVFRCRRRWRRPGEVLGREELPCLQPREGSTVLDSVSTAWRAGSQATQRVGRRVSSAWRLRAWRRPPAGAGARGRGGRPSAGGRPARPAARCARRSRPAGRPAAPRPG
jgi:hypothetical protein